MAKSGLNKIRAHQFELKVTDFESPIKSLTPGEWCLIAGGKDENWIGYLNPMVDEKFTCAYIVTKILTSEIELFKPEIFINKMLKKAQDYRSLFKGYEKNSRLFYGSSDGLPGLIIDQFESCSIIQINTAGIDLYRESIKSYLFSLTQRPVFFLDNEQYRKKEFLPLYDSEKIPEINIWENNLQYIIRAEVVQKIGFYFDHRENRYQINKLIERLIQKPHSAVDLFCYAGAWGINALKAGVSKVDFVDQGDFRQEIEGAIKINKLANEGIFIRSDVFKFLDDIIRKGAKYDLVLCDPPAFAKSLGQKNQAMEGYSKLHRKVFKVINSGGIIAFSSCTHYVTHDEFQKNVLDAAAKESKKVRLVYSGKQAFDHPVLSSNDKANYIKSYFYTVE